MKKKEDVKTMKRKQALKIVSIFFILDLFFVAVPPSFASKTKRGKQPFNPTPKEGIFIAPRSAPRPLDEPSPGFYETSDFMIGKAAVSIILPESNGTIDSSSEDWTEEEKSKVYREIRNGLDWWEVRAVDRDINLEFVIAEKSVVETGYEPIIHPRSEESLWISEIMEKMGYETGDHLEKVRKYNNC